MIRITGTLNSVLQGAGILPTNISRLKYGEIHAEEILGHLEGF